MLQSLGVHSECCSHCALQPLTVEVTCRAPPNWRGGYRLTRVQQSVKVCPNRGSAHCVAVSTVHCALCTLPTVHCTLWTCGQRTDKCDCVHRSVVCVPTTVCYPLWMCVLPSVVVCTAIILHHGRCTLTVISQTSERSQSLNLPMVRS